MPPNFRSLYIILRDKQQKALGKPKETVKIVDIPENGSVKYYRDQDQVHYVPKRHLEDVLI